jgi:hypothetical protein
LRRRSLPNRRNSFRVATNQRCTTYPQGFKANPGLKLANAFSVKLPGHGMVESAASFSKTK